MARPDREVTPVQDFFDRFVGLRAGSETLGNLNIRNYFNAYLNTDFAIAYPMQDKLKTDLGISTNEEKEAFIGEAERVFAHLNSTTAPLGVEDAAITADITAAGHPQRAKFFQRLLIICLNEREDLFAAGLPVEIEDSSPVSLFLGLKLEALGLEKGQYAEFKEKFDAVCSAKEIDDATKARILLGKEANSNNAALLELAVQYTAVSTSIERITSAKVDADLLTFEQNIAAIRVQAAFRGHRVRADRDDGSQYSFVPDDDGSQHSGIGGDDDGKGSEASQERRALRDFLDDGSVASRVRGEVESLRRSIVSEDGIASRRLGGRASSVLSGGGSVGFGGLGDLGEARSILSEGGRSVAGGDDGSVMGDPIRGGSGSRSRRRRRGSGGRLDDGALARIESGIDDIKRLLGVSSEAIEALRREIREKDGEIGALCDKIEKQIEKEFGKVNGDLAGYIKACVAKLRRGEELDAVSEELSDFLEVKDGKLVVKEGADLGGKDPDKVVPAVLELMGQVVDLQQEKAEMKQRLDDAIQEKADIKARMEQLQHERETGEKAEFDRVVPYHKLDREVQYYMLFV